MHEYYKSKEKKLKSDMFTFLDLIKEEIEKEFNAPYSVVSNEIWDLYFNTIVDKFPYIGGDKERGTGNLTGAFSFIAMGVVGERYNVSLETWGYLTTILYKRFYEKFPKFVLKIMGKTLRSGKLIYKLMGKKEKKDLWPYGFINELQPATDEYSLIYHIKRCPLYLVAKELGYLKYMPYICNLDYVSFNVLDVPFEREFTCASGGPYCDFKFKKDGDATPYWPCHSLNDKSPFK